jgi:hypothetical protein
LQREPVAVANVDNPTTGAELFDANPSIESAVALPAPFQATSQSVAADVQLTPIQELFSPGQPMTLLTHPGKHWNMEPLMPPPLPPAVNPSLRSPERFNFGAVDLAASLATGGFRQQDVSSSTGGGGVAAVTPAPRVVMFPSISPFHSDEAGQIGEIGEPISETSPTVVPLPAPLALGVMGLGLAALARGRFARWA